MYSQMKMFSGCEMVPTTWKIYVNYICKQYGAVLALNINVTVRIFKQIE